MIQIEKTTYGRNETRLELCEGHLRDPIVALDKALKCLENSCQRVCWPESLVEGAIPNGRREKPNWEGVWAYLDPMDSVCLRTASVEWNVPGKYGPHGELFFFLIQEELATVPAIETLAPSSVPSSAPPFSLLMSSISERLLPCT